MEDIEEIISIQVSCVHVLQHKECDDIEVLKAKAIQLQKENRLIKESYMKLSSKLYFEYEIKF